MPPISDGLKEGRTLCCGPSRLLSLKIQYLLWYVRGINAHSVGELHVYEGAFHLGMDWDFKETVFSHQGDISFQDIHAYFSRTMLGLILHRLLSPIENVWHIMKMRIRQRQPQPVEQLMFGIQQEWTKTTNCKLVSTFDKQ